MVKVSIESSTNIKKVIEFAVFAANMFGNSKIEVTDGQINFEINVCQGSTEEEIEHEYYCVMMSETESTFSKKVCELKGEVPELIRKELDEIKNSIAELKEMSHTHFVSQRTNDTFSRGHTYSITTT